MPARNVKPKSTLNDKIESLNKPQESRSSELQTEQSDVMLAVVSGTVAQLHNRGWLFDPSVSEKNLRNVIRNAIRIGKLFEDELDNSL